MITFADVSNLTILIGICLFNFNGFCLNFGSSVPKLDDCIDIK